MSVLVYTESEKGIFYEFKLKGKEGEVEVLMNNNCVVVPDDDDDDDHSDHDHD